MPNDQVTASISTGDHKAITVALPKDMQTPSPSFLNDPVVATLVWVAVVIGCIVAIAKPIKDWLRGERREDKVDKVQESKAEAESGLYTHLSTQVAQYRAIADQAFKERNDLIQRVGALEVKAEDLVEQKRLVEKLKERLDQKDEELRRLLQQSAEERSRFLTILELKDAELAKKEERIVLLEQGLRELEMRLLREERIVSNFICPMERKDIANGDTTN